MSVKLMAQVWEKELSRSEQTILLAMADFADDDGRRCHPSYERIAWKTGYSARQVQRIIKGLCAQGIVRVEKAATQHQPTQYAICLDKAKDKPPFRVDISGARVDISDSRVDFSGDSVDMVSIQPAARVDILRGSIDKASTQPQSSVDMASTQDAPRVDICNARVDILPSRVDIAMSTDPSSDPPIEPPKIGKRENDDEGKARGEVMRVWMENIPGTLSPIISERLHDLIDECGVPSVIHGITASVQAGARNYSYVAACARNHAAGRVYDPLRRSNGQGTRSGPRQGAAPPQGRRQSQGADAVDSFFARLSATELSSTEGVHS